jgi:hypothetical protein
LLLNAITKVSPSFCSDNLLLDSVNTSQSDHNASTEALISSDNELNGTINRAASEGAKFTLMMAMLEQAYIHRPHIEASQQINQSAEVSAEVNPDFHHYRASPLSANDSSWQTCQQTSQLIHTGQLLSAQLWLALHPEPLSQYNQSDRIDADVIANCSINTQSRMQQAQEKVVTVDETGLYDILQELEPISAQALCKVS